MAVTSLTPGHRPGPYSLVLSTLENGRRAFAILAAVFLISVAPQFSVPLNHDAAWYLHSARAFLEGGELYGDIYLDMNLPLPLYLSVPPVAVSEASGLSIVSVFRLYVFAWTLFSCWLAWRLLKGLVSEASRRGLMIFLLGALSVMPLDHFGQREHFLIIATLPYLILCARRAEGLASGPGWAALIGLQGALGISLKPFFVLVPAALEAYLLWRNRKPTTCLRPETLCLGSAGLAYLTVVFLHTPAYFDFVAPMAVDLYRAYNKPLFDVAFVWQLPVLGLALFMLPRSRARGRPALPGVLCLSALVFFAVYLLQMKGWHYHLYPTTACLFMFFGALIFSEPHAPDTASALGVEGLQGRVSAARIAFAASLVLIGSFAAQGYVSARDHHAYLSRMVPALRQHAKDRSFLFLASNLTLSFPLAQYAEIRFVSRFPMLWPIAGLHNLRHGTSEPLSREDRVRLAEYESFVIDAVVSDFERWKPKVVIVDERPDKPYIRDREIGIAFDYIAYLSADPRFAALWENYELVERTGQVALFARR